MNSKVWDRASKPGQAEQSSASTAMRAVTGYWLLATGYWLPGTGYCYWLLDTDL